MKYNQHIRSCVQHVTDGGLAESDHLIPYLIRLRQISDEANQAFNYDSTPNVSQLDSVRAEILGRAFEQQLDHIETNFPQEVWENCEFNSGFCGILRLTSASTNQDELSSPANLY